MKKSSVLTRVALVSALTVVVLVFGGLFPSAAISLAALAGLFPAVLVKEHGYSYAFISYLVAGFLALFLSPVKSSVALFVMPFGLYQIIRQWFDGKFHPVLSYLFKFLFANLTFFFLFFCLTKLFLSVVPSFLHSFVLTWVAYLIAFVIYDFAGNEWLKFYIARIRH